MRPVRKIAWLGVALLLAGLPLASVRATGWRKDTNELAVINGRLRGKVVDHTANHGADRRIWSRSLYQRRDVYVYLPPNLISRRLIRARTSVRWRIRRGRPWPRCAKGVSPNCSGRTWPNSWRLC